MRLAFAFVVRDKRIGPALAPKPVKLDSEKWKAKSVPDIRDYARLRACAAMSIIVRSCRISAYFYESGPISMAISRKKPAKITVLLNDEEFARFDQYCRDRGFKKSTLIARLIRQFLDLEGYGMGPGAPRTPAARFGRS